MYGSQTPIDVHCSKLVEWLIQRRHCKRDWGENLATIRRKIKFALKDMPESQELKELLMGSRLDYFKSKKIVEILRTTEADTKNIFGYYSSQRMKDWQDIIYSYEKDCIYLAELATDLIRETNYEVPGIKKVIQRLNKEKDEAEREKTNLLKRSQQFNSEYQRLAQSYGIKGANVMEELRDELKNLAKLMNDIAYLAKGLDSGLEFYRTFADSTSKQDASNFLPALYHIITKGNTTVYEWKFGEPPEQILVVDSAPSSTSNSNQSEIELNDEIDFGDDLPSSSESSSGFVHVGNLDNKFVKVDEMCSSNVKIAKGDEAKLVLEFRKSRNQFLGNLYELEAFFKQLCSEEYEDPVHMDPSDMNKVVNIVRQIVDVVNKDRNRVLFQMCDSPSFIESVNERFAHKAKQGTDCSIKAESINVRICDILNQIRETEVQLKKSIIASKDLQRRVESCISELYGGRSINIMGC